MLKQRARIVAASVFALDLALIAAAFFIAFWARHDLAPRLAPGLFGGGFYPLAQYLPLLPSALAVWAPLLWFSGRYRSHRTISLRREAAALLRLTAVAAALLTLVVYALRLDARLLAGDKISRLWLLLFPALAGALLISEKIALRVTSHWVRSRGLNYRTVVVVGTGRQARALAEFLERHRQWGYRLVGFVAGRGEEGESEIAGHPVLGGLADLPRLVEENVVDEVLFAVSRRDLDDIEDLYLCLQEQGIITRFALDFFPHTQARMAIDELDGVPLLTFTTSPSSPLQLLLKRILDVALSALLMLLGLPVLLLVALAIKVTTRGNVLFRQTRCGLNGRTFTLYKFRTMVEGAEARQPDLLHLNEMDGPVFKLREDPRVTALGRFLRKFSLDELPQLWNVLRGDMSLVGPRPPIPEEVARYERWQRRRLAMKPGLTCLWQVSGRNELDFQQWMELDLEYIDTWSPWLDFKILLKTIPAVISGRGAS
jgi:exopolysaccharide biosynthesis polyprenyl glycosylphosphotransferase